VWAIGKRSGNGQSDQGGFGLLDAETRNKIFIKLEGRLLICDIKPPTPQIRRHEPIFGPLEFQGGKGGLMSKIKSPKTCLRKLSTIQGD
jgi:hypothetical protein